MDAVAVGAILCAVVSAIIVGWMFYKGYKLINEDTDKK